MQALTVKERVVEVYDEAGIKARLAKLDRSGKTAFAAACAERLFPLFERYGRVTGQGDVVALGLALEDAWRAARGEEVEDLTQSEEVADSLVPSDEDEMAFEVGYGENAAAAVAYALDTWQTDDPQDAALAARQVFNAGDYAAQESIPAFDYFSAPGVEKSLLESPAVQIALAGITADLALAESPGSDLWAGLREQAGREGAAWACTLP